MSMDETHATTLYGTIVEEEVHFTLVDLSRACKVDADRLIGLVEEGVLEPEGGAPGAWRFSGASLHRARTALRLGRDFELNATGTALVLDLLDEIASLKARLHRHGSR